MGLSATLRVVSAGLRQWCNSYCWTLANQALTIRKVVKKVQNGAEKVQEWFPICEESTLSLRVIPRISQNNIRAARPVGLPGLLGWDF